MPTLTLTLVRYLDRKLDETRAARGASLTLGRDAECDWALADPGRSLSRRHCQFECVDGTWQLLDLSSNGTFLNASAEPLGRGATHAAADGDRLQIGDYEIEVRIARDAPQQAFSARLPGLDDSVLSRRAFTFPASLPDHTPASADAYVERRAAVDAAAPQSVVPDNWLDDPSAVKPAPPAPAPQPRPAFDDMTAALASLMSGGDLPPEATLRAAADPRATLHTAGALLRTAVAGIRSLLIARGSVKREFRIEATMLGPRENNALKFAASDEQALAALLAPRAAGLEALRESIRDLTLHQVAVLAATQAAARTLLQQLDPIALEAADTGGGLLPGAREKRLWDAHRQRHAMLIEQFEDDFESAFGKSFARAYEQAVKDEPR